MTFVYMCFISQLKIIEVYFLSFYRFNNPILSSPCLQGQVRFSYHFASVECRLYLLQKWPLRQQRSQIEPKISTIIIRVSGFKMIPSQPALPKWLKIEYRGTIKVWSIIFQTDMSEKNMSGAKTFKMMRSTYCQTISYRIYCPSMINFTDWFHIWLRSQKS